MPRLTRWYCGMVLYLSNSACHCACDSGGTTPVTGFHSTIERPDCVSRVAPPTTTMANTSAARQAIHRRIRPRASPAGTWHLHDGRPYRPRSGAEQYGHLDGGFMRPRIRKLIGTVALLALVVVWSLLAMALAQIVLVRTNGALDFVYYVVAGLGWVPLAMLLISWMSRGERPNNNT